MVCCGSEKSKMGLLWLFGNIWDILGLQLPLLCWIFWKGLRLKTSNNCCVPTLSDLFDLTETFHMFHHASTFSCLLCGWPKRFKPMISPIVAIVLNHFEEAKSHSHHFWWSHRPYSHVKPAGWERTPPPRISLQRIAWGVKSTCGDSEICCWESAWRTAWVWPGLLEKRTRNMEIGGV